MTETRAYKGRVGRQSAPPAELDGVSVASQERVTSGVAPVRASAVPHPEPSRGVDSSELRVPRARRDLNIGKTGQRRWKHNAHTARTSSAYRSASLMWRAPCEITDRWNSWSLRRRSSCRCFWLSGAHAWFCGCSCSASCEMLCRSPLWPYARRPQTVPSLSDPCLQ
jgi:hypothetical protein